MLVHLVCPVYPTEDSELVRRAVESVLGASDIALVSDGSDTILRASWNRQQSLEILRQAIHERRIIDAVRSRLLSNWDGEKTFVMFDKQAGHKGRVRLIDDLVENPPLGSITLSLSFDSETGFRQFLKWFAPPTANGRVVNS